MRRNHTFTQCINIATAMRCTAPPLILLQIIFALAASAAPLLDVAQHSWCLSTESGHDTLEFELSSICDTPLYAATSVGSDYARLALQIPCRPGKGRLSVQHCSASGSCVSASRTGPSVTAPADFREHARGLRVWAPFLHTNRSCTRGKVLVDVVCSPKAAPHVVTVEERDGGCTLAFRIVAPSGCPARRSVATRCSLHAIPTPTKPQLEYQRHEIMGLTHFNMATFVANGDPACNPSNWNKGFNCSDPALFNPVGLNVSNWIESYKAVGAKHAVLTAKHGCGFLLWDSDSKLPDGSEYGYGVKRSSRPSFGRDVVAEFSSQMQAAGLGHGFYYSTGNNFYLNVMNFEPAGALLPGQANVTTDQYNALVFEHVKELWTRFGSLFEIWFDHGYAASQKKALEQLLMQHQPLANGFNGFGIMPNPIKWVGTESGTPDYPIWSTGCENQGDPTSSDWCPTGVDTTLQDSDTWFYVPGMGIRTLQELINVYHDSVGNNGVLELDFAIDRTGNVAPDHAAAYKALGDWARKCYGSPIAKTNGNNATLTLTLSQSATIDRVMLQEDLTLGQRVRSWTLETMASGGSWTKFANGTSIGHKRIQLGESATVTGVRLTIDSAVAQPAIMNFAIFAPCPSS
eukprot:m.292192 g.292192  ORF g.292192 m.292192 type:complete len:631 (-) comp12583_c0_seq1:139-2031(-)